MEFPEPPFPPAPSGVVTFRLHLFPDFLQYLAERLEMTSPWRAVALAKAAGREVKGGPKKTNTKKAKQNESYYNANAEILTTGSHPHGYCCRHHHLHSRCECHADDHSAERSVHLIQPYGEHGQRADYAGQQQIGAGHGL